MASGLRTRASEARAIQARWREGKSKRRVTSKDSLFHHHHHPNFYEFFPRAIAPFTGINFQSNQLACKWTSQLVFSNNDPWQANKKPTNRFDPYCKHLIFWKLKTPIVKRSKHARMLRFFLEAILIKSIHLSYSQRGWCNDLGDPKKRNGQVKVRPQVLW